MTDTIYININETLQKKNSLLNKILDVFYEEDAPSAEGIAISLQLATSCCCLAGVEKESFLVLCETLFDQFSISTNNKTPIVN